MLANKEYVKKMANAVINNNVSDQHRKMRISWYDVIETGDYVICPVAEGNVSFYREDDKYVVKYKNKHTKNKQKFDCFDEAYLNFIHRAANDGVSFHRG